MTITEAFDALLDEYSPRAGEPAVQIFTGDAWRSVPLEWNVAVRVADIAGTVARMVDGNGDVMFPKAAEHA